MVDTITHSITQAGQADRTDTVYEDVLKEEIPDRFKDLLAQLREKDQKGGTS